MPAAGTLLATDYRPYACNIFINNVALEAGFEIISVQVKQGYQHITSAQLVLKSSPGLLSSTVTSTADGNLPSAGKPLSVKAKSGFEEIVLFEGLIVKHKFKNSTAGTRLHITAKNKSVNLAIKTKTEVFAGKTDKEIIEALAAAGGCNASMRNVTGKFLLKHTHLVKNEISDWDFINVRAEANGCFVYTENDTITIDKPTPALNPLDIITASYGANVFEVEVEQDDRKFLVKNELISFNLTSFQNEKAAEESNASLSSSQVNGLGSQVNYRAFNDMESTELLNAITRLKTISKVNGLVHIKPDLKIKPGATIEITGFNELVNEKYIITSVMQDYSDGGFSTYIQFGLNHESYASKFNLKTEPARQAIVTGIVTQLQDDPDNLTRIQVKIASWHYSEESIWARLSTSYAGPDYGMVVLPEIGDEVLVGFIGNDYDVPVVLGSMFSPKFPPHTNFSDENFEKVFVTKKGMKWLWNDEKGIHEVSTPTGNKIILSEDDQSITIKDQNGNEVVMNNSDLNITGSKNINIKANANIKIEGINVDVIASGINTIKGANILIN